MHVKNEGGCEGVLVDGARERCNGIRDRGGAYLLLQTQRWSWMLCVAGLSFANLYCRMSIQYLLWFVVLVLRHKVAA